MAMIFCYHDIAGLIVPAGLPIDWSETPPVGMKRKLVWASWSDLKLSWLQSLDDKSRLAALVLQAYKEETRLDLSDSIE